MSRDVIELVGVRAWGHHGVLEHEKRTGQEFLVDARLHVDTRAAARADALGRTVNYAEVAASIVAQIESAPVDLLETVAETLAARILAEQVLVRRIEVTLHKPSAPIPHPFADVRLHIVRDAAPVDAVLAVGTNLGDRAARLRRALDLLAQAEDVEILWTGPVIETDPVGGIEQDPFLNSAVGVRTRRTPWQLLELAQELEADAQRERRVRWGPRTLDVDVITYGDLVQEDEELILPHPRAAERAFVLVPWASARPEDELPGHGPIGPLAERAPDRPGIRPGPAVPGYAAPSPVDGADPS